MSRQKTDGANAKSALSEMAYQRIRQMVLENAFPAGRRISEARLGAELGVSRTPVREAIQRLTREGLIIQRPSSGTYVVTLQAAEIKDIYEVRMALEAMLAGKAAQNADRASIRRLQVCIQDMKRAIRLFLNSGEPVLQGALLERYHEADKAFHDLILEMAGNRFAQTIVSEGYIKQFIYSGQSHLRDRRHVVRLWSKHARVAQAVKRGDPEASRRRMEELIQASMSDALTKAGCN